MATVIDLDAELRAVKRGLIYARRDRDRDYLRKQQGVDGAAEEYDLSCAKVKRLEDELASIEGAAKLEQEDRTKAARAAHERARDAAKKRFSEVLSNAVCRAERIDAILDGRGPQTGASFSGLAPEIVGLRADFEEARRCQAEFVNEQSEHRTLERYEAIRRELWLQPIEDWLEAAAFRLGLVKGRGPVRSDSDREPLADLVRTRVERALKVAEREFGGA